MCSLRRSSSSAAIALKDLVLDANTTASGTAGSRLVEFSVDSELLGEQLPVNVVIPPGARDGRRSLLVFLHGRGDDESSYLSTEMFSALARQGGRAPIVAFPRGGPDSYWHDRDDGAWGSYVLDELVPAWSLASISSPSGSRSAGSRWAASVPSTSPVRSRSH